MNDQSQKSSQQISKDISNAISSAVSQDGPELDLFGQPLFPASPSVVPGKEKHRQTNGICSLSSKNLSLSADLMSYLENRFRRLLEKGGSMEYAMHWVKKTTPSGRQYCQLVASGRRTSGKDFGGWPRTPHASDGEGGVMEIRPGTSGHYKLRDYAQTAGWPQLTTPPQSGGPAVTGSGGECQLGGWATPRSGPSAIYREDMETREKREREGTIGGGAVNLADQAEMAGYPTPNHNSTGPGNQGRAGGENLQTNVEQFRLPDMTGWRLNPRFSLWLQGYPAEWAFCGERAMQSTRKSQPNLSRRT